MDWLALIVGVVAFASGWILSRRYDRHATPPESPAPPPLDNQTALNHGLESVRRGLRAGRTIVWRISPDGERAHPWLVLGGLFPARTVPLAGDVLGWAVRQNLPLRSESAPLWALDGAQACGLAPIPVREGAAVLSAEFADPRDLPSTDDLERAAAYLGAFIDLETERAASIEHRTRLAALTNVLRRLPAELESGPLTGQLAHAAIELTNASGACVMEWEGDHGRVAALSGEQPVAPGVRVGPQESEAAMAARAAATIARAGRSHLPVIATGERFQHQPRAFAAIPLILSGATRGVVVVWTPLEQLNPHGLEALAMLAPYAALQLGHAQAFSRMRERADHDRLTGLLNRQAFDRELAGEVARFQRYQRPFALLMLDLDHFKAVNDRYGHPVGDEVLASIGKTLVKTLREVDVPARYGGEEFAIIIPETSLETALDVAERIRVAIAGSPVSTSAGRLNLTVSIGVSALPQRATDAAALIRSADAALYTSKRNGRNQVTAAD